MASGGVEDKVAKVDEVDSEEEETRPQNVWDHMAALLFSERCADVFFNCVDNEGNNERIPGHRMVLSMWSDVYEIMFFGSLPETREITIQDIPANIFKEFLSFLYTDNFDTSILLAPQLLYCSEKYMIKSLRKRCTANINNNLLEWTPSTVALLESLISIGRRETTQVEQCLQLIEAHAREVFESDQFLNLEEGTVGLILQRDGLNSDEETIFRALVKWSEKECSRLGLPVSLDSQRQVLVGLIPCIRFPTMKLETLRLILRECPILEVSVIGELFLSLKPSLIFNSSPRVFNMKINSFDKTKILLVGRRINGSLTNEIREYSIDDGCTLLHTKMINERGGHAACFHPGTNEFIVAGGCGVGKSVESCILPFTPNSKFQSLPNMNQARFVCASCIAGNRFYVFGGWLGYGATVDHCEYFDISLRSWNPIAPLPQKLCFSSAISVKNNDNSKESIFLFGGSDGSSRVNTVYEYNAEDNKWEHRRDLQMPQHISRTVIVNFNGKIIICGGEHNDNDYSKSCYSLDLSTKMWQDFPSLNVGRELHAAAVVRGQIVVVGGLGEGGKTLKSVELFNGTEWVMGKELDGTMCNRFYVFGGGSGSGTPVDHCEYFDISFRSWNPIAPLPQKLEDSSAISLKNNDNSKESIFLFGGWSWSDSSRVNTVYEYNAEDNKWEHRRDLQMPQHISCTGIVNFNGKIIICGGEQNDNEYSKSCFSLDLSTKMWQDFPSLNVGRRFHSAAVVRGQIVVVGGEGEGRKELKSVELFNGKEWVMGKELDETMWAFSAVAIE